MEWFTRYAFRTGKPIMRIIYRPYCIFESWRNRSRNIQREWRVNIHWTSLWYDWFATNRTHYSRIKTPRETIRGCEHVHWRRNGSGWAVRGLLATILLPRLREPSTAPSLMEEKKTRFLPNSTTYLSKSLIFVACQPTPFNENHWVSAQNLILDI